MWHDARVRWIDKEEELVEKVEMMRVHPQGTYIELHCDVHQSGERDAQGEPELVANTVIMIPVQNTNGIVMSPRKDSKPPMIELPPTRPIAVPRNRN